MFDSVGIQQTKLVSLNICRGCGLIYKYFLIECIVIFVLLIKNVNITHQQLSIFVNNKYVRLIWCWRLKWYACNNSIFPKLYSDNIILDFQIKIQRSFNENKIAYNVMTHHLKSIRLLILYYCEKEFKGRLIKTIKLLIVFQRSVFSDINKWSGKLYTCMHVN